MGLTVGYLKDKYYDLNKKLNDEIDFLKEKLNDIKIINTSNRKIKDYYTDKLINSRESIGRIYDITSKIHKAEKGEVLFVALDILKEIMGTREVSIYLVSNNKYCRLASSTGEKAGSLGKSLLIKDYAVIFDALRMKQVFINRTLDNKLPMMASALFDDRQNMRIVIFLWDMPYDRMTLYNANLLTVVGALITRLSFRGQTIWMLWHTAGMCRVQRFCGRMPSMKWLIYINGQKRGAIRNPVFYSLKKKI